MNFKEWLQNEEGGSGNSDAASSRHYGSKLTPTGRAQEMYPKYKKDNSGCAGDPKPCASGDSQGGGGGAAPAAAVPSKMRKK